MSGIYDLGSFTQHERSTRRFGSANPNMEVRVGPTGGTAKLTAPAWAAIGNPARVKLLHKYEDGRHYIGMKAAADDDPTAYKVGSLRVVRIGGLVSFYDLPRPGPGRGATCAVVDQGTHIYFEYPYPKEGA